MFARMVARAMSHDAILTGVQGNFDGAFHLVDLSIFFQYNICTSSYIKYIDVVLDMGPHRAPGLDGFTAVFYQRFWEDLKPEIMKEISDFFERGEFDKQHNHTNLCLIPKIYPPIGMTEF